MRKPAPYMARTHGLLKARSFVEVVIQTAIELIKNGVIN